MADITITGLSDLGGAPASNDRLVIVDVSDGAQAPSGSTKDLSVANLFTSPTITSPILTTPTFTGLVTMMNDLNVAGVVMAGLATFTLPTTPVFINNTHAAGAGNGAIGFQRGGVNKYFLGFDASDSFILLEGGGGLTNLTVTAAGILTVRSAVIAARLIAAADVSTAIAKVVASDGTTAEGGTGPTVLGVLSCHTNANASGTWISSKVTVLQSVATSGTTYGAHHHAGSTHTSGTSAVLTGTSSSVGSTGVGGATTHARAYFANGVLTQGTVTNFTCYYAGVPLTGATITNHYGLYVENIAAGATLNYAIKTNGGRVGFVGIPTSSFGLASGDLWSSSGVINIVP